jgi:predicted dehydrogenase
MGLGRGSALLEAALSLPEVSVAWLCDVDDNRLRAAAEQVARRGASPPQTTADFRRILADRDVDALVIAACNHWHAPATILACQAGKHVYVEKPGSHNPHEAELMVQVAQRSARVVQLGTQRRSWPGIQEGIQRLHEGAIGAVRFARCWYTNGRPSIGRGRRLAAPSHLDYGLWQGPAPERPYKDNLVHYNWHWHWHWGNGELGNNGPHYLDLARWGLRVDYPRQISYAAGRYHFDDDQETPDTGVVTFDFGACGCSWEHSSCQARKPESLPLITFYGDGGALSLDGAGYVLHDGAGKKVEQRSGPSGDALHLADFLAAIREGKRPSADIADGQRSTLLCHLGNISYRVGRTLRFDPGQRRILGDAGAARLWKRAYRKGWEPRAGA